MFTFKKTVQSISILSFTIISASAIAQVNAKIGHAYPADHPQGVAMLKFSDLVNKYTSGRVHVQVHHSGTLGGDDKLMQGVQSGTQELYIGGVSILAGRVKEVQIFDFPFLFQNKKEVDYVLNGPSGQKLLDKISSTGVVAMAWSETGFRNLTNSKRPVKKADDINGLKIRVLQNPIALDTWKALGANATPMSFSELFTAMEIKAIDGQENPLLTISTNKFYEVQKYATLTGHVYSPVVIAASKKFMNSLSPEDQESVKRAAKEAAKYQRDLMDKADEQIESKLKSQGMIIDKLPADEIAKIQQKIKPVVEKYTAVVGEDLVKEFYGEIEKVRSNKI